MTTEKKILYLKRFETAFCSELGCDNTTDLLKHKTLDTLMCVHCVNNQLIEAQRIQDEENIFHDDYRDQTYNELLIEREA